MKDFTFEYDACIYTIKAGQTAQENWNLIDESNEDDIWFHVEDLPSCHVVLKNDGKNKLHKSVIKYCANICKEGSKQKHAKNVRIIYTEIKNVKKGKDVGSVTVSSIRHIKV
jgi:predicted ribosome quality control (RQC) complex YloA/Tae2 family protein